MLFKLDGIEPAAKTGKQREQIRQRGVCDDMFREERMNNADAAVKDRGAAIEVPPVYNGRLLRQDPVWRIGAHEAGAV